MSGNARDGWGQASELAWLEALGRHRIGMQGPSFQDGMNEKERRWMRVRCFEGYLRSMNTRTRWWRSADVGEIRARAEALLENAQRALAA